MPVYRVSAVHVQSSQGTSLAAALTANENHKKCKTRAKRKQTKKKKKKKTKNVFIRWKQRQQQPPSTMRTRPKRCQNQQFSSCKQFRRKQGAQRDAILLFSPLPSPTLSLANSRCLSLYLYPPVV